MQTYNPNNYSGNQTNQYQNQDPNHMQYNDNYYYGGGQTTQNPQDFMDMNTGFEANDVSRMAGIYNLNRIAAEEVVAKSFLFMVVALLITAVASLTTSPLVAYRMLTGYGFVLLLVAELGIVAVSNWAISKNNAILAGILFAAYSYLTGVTLSVIFVAYSLASITVIFLVTAMIFGIMAIWGLVTKRDLTSVGSLLVMGLLGIVIVSFVNLFLLRSTMLDTVICSIGVLIFVGLIAYDAQKVKRMITMSNDGNVLTLALMGAFELYLDFINLFLKLLRLFGRKRR